MSKTLYLIADGDCALAAPDDEWDGTASVLAYAETPEDAMTLAEAYDAGRLQPDNVWINGTAVAALS